jgi:hypothetical protein
MLPNRRISNLSNPRSTALLFQFGMFAPCQKMPNSILSSPRVQSNLVKREFFKRDFALSGTFFAASTFPSQINLVMRDSPKCKRDSPKFWPKADFFLN